MARPSGAMRRSAASADTQGKSGAAQPRPHKQPTGLLVKMALCVVAVVVSSAIYCKFGVVRPSAVIADAAAPTSSAAPDVSVKVEKVVTAGGITVDNAFRD